VVDNFFMSSRKEKKVKNPCPVCGSQMEYKERVSSYYCPKCRSFY